MEDGRLELLPFQTGIEATEPALLLLTGGSAVIGGIVLMLFTGASLAVSIPLVIFLIILAFYAGIIGTRRGRFRLPRRIHMEESNGKTR